MSQLSDYGHVLAAYEGRGMLEWGNANKVSVEFETGQLASGQIILLSFVPGSSPHADLLLDNPYQVYQFEGSTADDQYEIRAEGCRETIYLPEMRSASGAGVHSAFTCEHLWVHPIQHVEQANELRYGITNFVFLAIQGEASSNQSNQGMERVLALQLGDIRATMKPVSGYGATVSRLRALKSTDVTCELVVRLADDQSTDTLESTVDDLCYLLSVARGTKINWIYRRSLTADGKEVETLHAARTTKPYSPLAIIDPRSADETRDFVESSYDKYLQHREPYQLNQGTIDAYLDAKLEHDYLEIRGAKLAVALERLKRFFAQAENIEYIVEPEIFDQRLDDLLAAFTEFLKSFWEPSIRRNQIKRNAIDMMAPKARGLHRRSFASIIRRLRKGIGLQVSEDEIQMFVRSRNDLIHNGDFSCSLGRDDLPIPVSDPVDEWLFVLNFLDRIFLKLLGYDGFYLNWRHRPPERESLD